MHHWAAVAQEEERSSDIWKVGGLMPGFPNYISKCAHIHNCLVLDGNIEACQCWMASIRLHKFMK